MVKAKHLDYGDEVMVGGVRWRVESVVGTRLEWWLTMTSADGRTVRSEVDPDRKFVRAAAHAEPIEVGWGEVEVPAVLAPLQPKLVAVEAGGDVVVPPVQDGTVVGHLLLMHGVRFDGATIAEAREWVRTYGQQGRGSVLTEAVFTGADLAAAFRVHDELHRDVGVGHVHRDRVPR